MRALAKARSAPLAAAALIALSLALAACGGEEEGGSGAGPSAQEVEERQAEADAEVRERNERVHREYRERQQAAAPSEEEEEARRAVSSFYETLGGEGEGGGGESGERGGGKAVPVDAESFCDLMSEAAIEQTIAYARQASGEAKDWDCEKAIELLVLRSKQTGGFKRAQKAKVVGVNAEGDRATASVRFGKGPIAAIPLVREDGEWKLAASPAGGG